MQVALNTFAMLKPEPERGVRRDTLVEACVEYHPSVTREGILGTLIQVRVFHLMRDLSNTVSVGSSARGLDSVQPLLCMVSEQPMVPVQLR